jgi:acetolactate synthase-like protein
VSPLPVSIPLASNEDIEAVASLLLAAKRPVLLLGSQCMLLGDSGAAALRDAVEKLGCPTFLGGMARGLLGRSSPFHIRQNRGQALKKADLVLLLGMVPDFRMDYGRGLPKGVPIVSVNRSAEDLHKNSWIFWSAKVASQADPCSFACRYS